MNAIVDLQKGQIEIIDSSGFIADRYELEHIHIITMSKQDKSEEKPNNKPVTTGQAVTRRYLKAGYFAR